METDNTTTSLFALERVLHMKKGERDLLAKLTFRPPAQKDGIWRCHWSLEILHPTGVAMSGNDPLEALIRCLSCVAQFIRGSEVDGWEIWWQTKGDHGGLPIIEKWWVSNVGPDGLPIIDKKQD